MRQNKLFSQTRIRLAGWYALVIGLLLGLSGIGLYQAALYAQQYTLRQKLESLAGTLHDSLEPLLEHPGELSGTVRPLLPGVCLASGECFQPDDSRRHIAGVFQQEGYYLRFLDRTGQTIAFAGEQPVGKPTAAYWQRLVGVGDKRFEQISMPLRTKTGAAWGYLQIGRSLQDWDNYLHILRLTLLLGLPFVMLLVGGASWWLSGLAMQPIYRSYRQMQQFTSDAAHELRTPLTVLQSTLEDTWVAIDLPEVHQNLEIMERQNLRLSKLVKDLLLICRLEQPAPIKLHPCCLNDLIIDLQEELISVADAVDVLLQTKLPEDLVIVLGDESQLYRLGVNLITNAIHHTPAGGTVTVTLEGASHEALIHVQDTGIGIPPDQQAQIFERFYRVQSDRSRATGGSGLGLSIAQAIVQAHEGSIQLDSEVGKGSRFTVRLPLNHVDRHSTQA